MIIVQVTNKLFIAFFLKKKSFLDTTTFSITTSFDGKIYFTVFIFLCFIMFYFFQLDQHFASI